MEVLYLRRPITRIYIVNQGAQRDSLEGLSRHN